MLHPGCSPSLPRGNAVARLNGHSLDLPGVKGKAYPDNQMLRGEETSFSVRNGFVRSTCGHLTFGAFRAPTQMDPERRNIDNFSTSMVGESSSCSTALYSPIAEQKSRNQPDSFAA